ncbi:hypothetical protein BDN72DRAFT_870121 [Pluteus cervinus]|uniref:Uncharacterized protein n=1 Tax=Pluteus cervinus TaxID=181527 RepID=A0ACD3AZX9_9AGAR|nr:hypothetical protein BDN72DRAFT_870121 [Pluteus cervinus]
MSSYEGTMKVPISVLDGCEASFTAADERRKKASTQWFDDTAIMALLCRHDRVLWLVNMRSAGEKQHYALVLLETLFQHLPLHFIIGVLYDIGCQLHRSCIKWGFLSPYIHRIMFAISVFHAYGHQWPCQLIYHPRKCDGFGLSDGEGCERFWHSISKLISVLRVSGYHQRLYRLDLQVQHDDHSSLFKLGYWLLRRSRNCQQRKLKAEAALRESGLDEQTLREQWGLQLERSKHLGKDAVEEALRLRTARDTLEKQLRKLQDCLIDSSADEYLQVTAQLEIPLVEEELAKAQARVQKQEALLGVGDRLKLSTLINSPFIQHCLNARALKIRLREKLRSRRFELDAMHQERKLDEHTTSSVQRRDPSIQQLACNYNKLCDEMARLISSHKAPRGAAPPDKLPTQGLFNLDVDDPIWQDTGLDDSSPEKPPLWLSDERTRNGIKALIERDRCNEEAARLQHERRAMQIWLQEEWDVVNMAYNHVEDESVQLQLHRKQQELC